MNRLTDLKDKEKLLSSIIDVFIKYTLIPSDTGVREPFYQEVEGIMKDIKMYGFFRVNKKNENKYDKTCESKNPDITLSSQTNAV